MLHNFLLPLLCNRLHELLLDDAYGALDEKSSFRRLITASGKGNAERSKQGRQVCTNLAGIHIQGRSCLQLQQLFKLA